MFSGFLVHNHDDHRVIDLDCTYTQNCKLTVFNSCDDNAFQLLSNSWLVVIYPPFPTPILSLSRESERKSCVRVRVMNLQWFAFEEKEHVENNKWEKSWEHASRDARHTCSNQWSTLYVTFALWLSLTFSLPSYSPTFTLFLPLFPSHTRWHTKGIDIIKWAYNKACWLSIRFKRRVFRPVIVFRVTSWSHFSRFESIIAEI